MALLLDLQGTWSPENRAEMQCRTVGFDVPSGAEGIRVELRYDGSGGGVLDLGCQGPGGYVGWSGGARSEYVVSERWATPGYLPTPMTTGRWGVLVGLHRVPAPGVRFALKASTVRAAEVERVRQRSIVPDPPVPARPPARRLPGADGMSWRAADFHAHSVHSDGSLTAPELAALAVACGLDALAVTDHNTTSHHAELDAVGERYGIQLIPGQEVTTDRGHANAFGAIGFVDFRQPAEQWQGDVAARGGILSVNHPLAGDCAWQQDLERPTAVAEVFHSSWLLPFARTWGGPLAWWRTWGTETVPIGGSDFHRHGADALPGTPRTWVLCEDGEVLTGVAAGRTSVSAGPDAPLVLPMGDELLVIGGEGVLLTGFDRGRRVIHGDRVSLPLGAGPWWLEDDQMQVLALCG